jgi:hypothetical protein
VSTSDCPVMTSREMPLNRPAESTIIDRVLRRSSLPATMRHHGSPGMLHFRQDLTFSEQENRL